MNIKDTKLFFLEEDCIKLLGTDKQEKEKEEIEEARRKTIR